MSVIKNILLHLTPMINLSNKNIKISQAFKSFEWLWIFCVLFSTATIFLGNTDSKFEKQHDNFGITASSNHSNQNLKATHAANPLSDFEFIEISEISDENNEDDTTEGDYRPNTLTFFNYEFSKNSSANCRLYLHKRVFISLFLLHHSWKIPSA